MNYIYSKYNARLFNNLNYIFSPASAVKTYFSETFAQYFLLSMLQHMFCILVLSLCLLSRCIRQPHVYTPSYSCSFWKRFDRLSLFLWYLQLFQKNPLRIDKVVTWACHIVSVPIIWMFLNHMANFTQYYLRFQCLFEASDILLFLHLNWT